jgi:hypothetical protein
MMNEYRIKSLGVLFTLVLGAGFTACTEDDATSTNNQASGGMVGSGGAMPTGGTTPMGGALPATGATPGMGGALPTGGTTPMGGTTPIGGALPTGGVGTTGGAATGGTTVVPPTPIEGYAVEAGGYVKTCGMAGYAWVSAGPPTPDNTTGSLSSIVPDGFSTVLAGDPLCASGSVAADAAYGGYAMVGVNIGQVPGEDTPNVNVQLTGTGLQVSVTNNGGSQLRIQIQDDLGADDAAHRWCANLPASGEATLAWADFNTTCWAPTDGVAYAGEPINAVLVLVPGKNNADVAFDFCLNGFTQTETTACDTPTGAGGAGGAGGASPGVGGGGGVSAAGAPATAGAPGVGGAAGSPPVTGGAAGMPPVAAGAPATGGAPAAGTSPVAGQASG